MNAIFANKLESDDRDPVLTIPLPFRDDTSLEILLPSLTFWTQLTAVLFMQGLFGALIALIVHKLIIPRRETPTSYLVGYGIVIPCCMLFPFYVIRAFDIRNKVVKFMFTTNPAMLMFRCMEAMYDFSPPVVESSFSNYALYCATPYEPVYDPKTNGPVPTTLTDTLSYLRLFFKANVVSGIFLSTILPFHYEPFHTEIEASSLDHNFYDMIRYGHLGNNLIAAILFQQYLIFFGHALRTGFSLLFGAKVIDFMKNPVFESTSPSDFWGRRWNLLIHGVLKRGVYKPVIKHFPKIVAVMAVFVASGLFHEWILAAIFYIHDKNQEPSPFPTYYGKNMAFFIWNGIIIGLEFLIGKTCIFQWMAKIFPKPLITILVILLALPAAHWFAGDYIKSGFFENGQHAYFIFKIIRNK